MGSDLSFLTDEQGNKVTEEDVMSNSLVGSVIPDQDQPKGDASTAGEAGTDLSFLNDEPEEKSIEQIQAEEEAMFQFIMEEMMDDHRERYLAKEAGITLPETKPEPVPED